MEFQITETKNTLYKKRKISSQFIKKELLGNILSYRNILLYTKGKVYK